MLMMMVLVLVKNRIHELLIPAKVVKEHKLTLGKRLYYIDEHGSLKGKKAKYKDGRTCRYIGFDKITKRNSLKAGDTITCNLLHTRKLVHSVRIHINHRAP
ncbi:unnamed protein product [Arabidopsis lyrata]|nr:unnamed protein product [Arabidopsis lyrata]